MPSPTRWYQFLGRTASEDAADGGRGDSPAAGSSTAAVKQEKTDPPRGAAAVGNRSSPPRGGANEGQRGNADGVGKGASTGSGPEEGMGPTSTSTGRAAAAGASAAAAAASTAAAAPGPTLHEVLQVLARCDSGDDGSHFSFATARSLFSGRTAAEGKNRSSDGGTDSISRGGGTAAAAAAAGIQSGKSSVAAAASSQKVGDTTGTRTMTRNDDAGLDGGKAKMKHLVKKEKTQGKKQEAGTKATVTRATRTVEAAGAAAPKEVTTGATKAVGEDKLQSDFLVQDTTSSRSKIAMENIEGTEGVEKGKIRSDSDDGSKTPAAGTRSSSDPSNSNGTDAVTAAAVATVAAAVAASERMLRSDAETSKAIVDSSDGQDAKAAIVTPETDLYGQVVDDATVESAAPTQAHRDNNEEISDDNDASIPNTRPPGVLNDADRSSEEKEDTDEMWQREVGRVRAAQQAGWLLPSPELAAAATNPQSDEPVVAGAPLSRTYGVKRSAVPPVQWNTPGSTSVYNAAVTTAHHLSRVLAPPQRQGMPNVVEEESRSTEKCREESHSPKVATAHCIPSPEAKSVASRDSSIPRSDSIQLATLTAKAKNSTAPHQLGGNMHQKREETRKEAARLAAGYDIREGRAIAAREKKKKSKSEARKKGRSEPKAKKKKNRWNRKARHKERKEVARSTAVPRSPQPSQSPFHGTNVGSKPDVSPDLNAQEYTVRMKKPVGITLGPLERECTPKRGACVVSKLPCSLASTMDQIRIGDMLVAVDGKSVDGVAFDDVIDLIRRSPGEVSLTFIGIVSYLYRLHSSLMDQGDDDANPVEPVSLLAFVANRRDRHQANVDHSTRARSIDSVYDGNSGMERDEADGNSASPLEFSKTHLEGKRRKEETDKSEEVIAGTDTANTTDTRTQVGTTEKTPPKKKRGRPRTKAVVNRPNSQAKLGGKVSRSRTRGRPPKADVDNIYAGPTGAKAEVETAEEPPPKKKRGRPRTKAVVNRPNSQAKLGGKVSRSRTRGRPPKADVDNIFADPTDAKAQEETREAPPPKKKRGRPRKDVVVDGSNSQAQAPTVMSERRGRNVTTEKTTIVGSNAPPVNSLCPILPDDEWITVWTKLENSGWTSKQGSGLIDVYYVLPGRSAKKGVAGVDFFTSREAIQEYCEINYKWDRAGFEKRLQDKWRPYKPTVPFAYEDFDEQKKKHFREKRARSFSPLASPGHIRTKAQASSVQPPLSVAPEEGLAWSEDRRVLSPNDTSHTRYCIVVGCMRVRKTGCQGMCAAHGTKTQEASIPPAYCKCKVGRCNETREYGKGGMCLLHWNEYHDAFASYDSGPDPRVASCRRRRCDAKLTIPARAKHGEGLNCSNPNCTPRSGAYSHKYCGICDEVSGASTFATKHFHFSEGRLPKERRVRDAADEQYDSAARKAKIAAAHTGEENDDTQPNALLDPMNVAMSEFGLEGEGALKEAEPSFEVELDESPPPRKRRGRPPGSKNSKRRRRPDWAKNPSSRNSFPDDVALDESCETEEDEVSVLKRERDMASFDVKVYRLQANAYKGELNTQKEILASRTKEMERKSKDLESIQTQVDEKNRMLQAIRRLLPSAEEVVPEKRAQIEAILDLMGNDS